MSLESNCCGYPPHRETDLCGSCLEHAEFLDNEEETVNMIYKPENNELLAEANKGIGLYLVSHKILSFLFGRNAPKNIAKQQKEIDKSTLNIRELL
jgi:hypothetical protein